MSGWRREHITIDEIYARGEAIRWMQRMGWPAAVQDLICVRDCPSIEAVRWMCYQIGPDAVLAHIILVNDLSEEDLDGG